MDPVTLEMARVARQIVEQVLAIRADEQVLLVVDAERPSSITQALLSALGAVAEETILLTMKAHSAGSVEPPPMLAAAMQAADGVVF